MKVLSFSTKGQHKSINEDCTFSKKWINDRGEMAVIAIADGMGGYECGDIHSTNAISIIRNNVNWNCRELNLISSELDKAFGLANSSISIYNQENSKQGGTTLTCAVVIDDKLLIKNIGDTRSYLIRNNELLQLSEDHVVVDKNGIKTSKLTRCLGMGIHSKPFELRLEVKKSDVVIVCSDGFYNKLNNNEIIELTNKLNEMDDSIMSATIKKLYERRELDNISIALIMI